MVEDIRHDYLEREYERLCQVNLMSRTSVFGPFSSQKARLDSENSTLPVPQILGRNADEALKQTRLEYFADSRICSDLDDSERIQEKESAIQRINERTTTIFASSPQVILPSDSHGNPIGGIHLSEDGSVEQPYLHLILPAN